MSATLPALTATEKATQDASIIRADSVNAWLENLKATDAPQFELVRRSSFEEIATMAGLQCACFRSTRSAWAWFLWLQIPTKERKRELELVQKIRVRCLVACNVTRAITKA